jgi:ferredoxin
VNKRSTVTKNVEVRIIPNRYLIVHNRKACVGCGLCASMCPENWTMAEDGKATPKKTEIKEAGANKDVADACPAGCIKIVNKRENDIF